MDVEMNNNNNNDDNDSINNVCDDATPSAWSPPLLLQKHRRQPVPTACTGRR